MKTWWEIHDGAFAHITQHGKSKVMHTKLTAKKILGFVLVVLFFLSFSLFLAYTYEHAQPATSTVLYDGNFSYWTAGGGGSGSLGVSISSSTSTVESGTSSLQINLTSGSYGEIEVGHDYSASPQNWSRYTYLSFYIYGLNSSNNIVVGLRAPDQNDCIDYVFQDNFLGWRQINFPFHANATAVQGTLPETLAFGKPNLSDITEVGWFFSYEPYVYYIDNVTLNGNSSTHLWQFPLPLQAQHSRPLINWLQSVLQTERRIKWW
jgi:hypothetical protein